VGKRKKAFFPKWKFSNGKKGGYNNKRKGSKGNRSWEKKHVYLRKVGEKGGSSVAKRKKKKPKRVRGRKEGERDKNKTHGEEQYLLNPKKSAEAEVVAKGRNECRSKRGEGGQKSLRKGPSCFPLYRDGEKKKRKDPFLPGGEGNLPGLPCPQTRGRGGGIPLFSGKGGAA